MKQTTVQDVDIDMSNTTIKHMTHQQIADHLGVSTKTIDRHRDAGKLSAMKVLSATKVNGKWVYEIEVEKAVETDTPTVETPVVSVSEAEVNQLRSEVTHLRDALKRSDEALQRRDAELERQDSLLAMAMHQKGELISQLALPDREPLLTRAKNWILNKRPTPPSSTEQNA